MKKNIIIAILILLAACSSAPSNSEIGLKPKPIEMKIDSYDKCVAAGYPVARSYPPQCHTPDGKVFWGPK